MSFLIKIIPFTELGVPNIGNSLIKINYMKKYLLIIFFFFFTSNHLNAKIKIKYKIGDEIITNIDIKMKKII